MAPCAVTSPLDRLAPLIEGRIAPVAYQNKAVVYDRMGQPTHAADLYREVLSMYSEGSLKEALPLDAIRSRLAVLR